MSLSLDQLRYEILPGRPDPQSSALEVYNEAYTFWKQTWEPLLTTFSAQLDLGDFWRQDLITVIRQQDLIVGMHLYCFFNLQTKASCEHPYVAKYFTPAVIAQLREEGIRYVMSLEYLTVHPDWRASKTKIKMPEVLGGLAALNARANGIDANIAAARSDVGVERCALNLGGKVLSSIDVHRVPTAIMVLPPSLEKATVDVRVNHLIHQLWKGRRDHTQDQSNSRRIAA